MKKLFQYLLTFAASSSAAAGASLAIDTFDEREFSLTFNVPGHSSRADFNSPLGTTERVARFDPVLPAAGAVGTAVLNSAAGYLATDIRGESISTTLPLHLAISYFGGSFSLLGYDAFELEFTSLSGQGFLFVEVGSQQRDFGPETIRIPLREPGVVTVPFGAVNFTTNGSIESSIAAHFVFAAESTDGFSFTLEEIRAVPEPSGIVLIGLGVIVCLSRRRRA